MDSVNYGRNNAQIEQFEAEYSAMGVERGRGSQVQVSGPNSLAPMNN